MRQQGDSVYANLLANARHGEINDPEYALLETRCISNNDRASIGEVLNLQTVWEYARYPDIVKSL